MVVSSMQVVTKSYVTAIFTAVKLYGSGPNVEKLFRHILYELNVYYKLVFFPGKSFNPSVMFVDKVRSIPLSAALTRVCSGLALKH